MGMSAGGGGGGGQTLLHEAPPAPLAPGETPTVLEIDWSVFDSYFLVGKRPDRYATRHLYRRDADSARDRPVRVRQLLLSGEETSSLCDTSSLQARRRPCS